MNQRDTPTCVWRGMSGRQYTFYVFQLPYAFNANQDGNYIFARLNEQQLWVPVYIGQGDLARRANPDTHERGMCIRQRGATHVHCHLNPLQADRLTEERDLLNRYTNAHAPYGCNEAT